MWAWEVHVLGVICIKIIMYGPLQGTIILVQEIGEALFSILCYIKDNINISVMATFSSKVTPTLNIFYKLLTALSEISSHSMCQWPSATLSQQIKRSIKKFTAISLHAE